MFKENPFSKYDFVASLSKKKKPAKQRGALDHAGFWAIYEHANVPTQIAMLISLTTTMRRDDIVRLRLDENVQDGQLQATLTKSLNQRGAAAAAHLSWELNEHKDLKKAVDLGRERSLRYHRCPYIVSKRRVRKDVQRSTRLQHNSQCLPEYISRQFRKARDKTVLWEGDDHPPSFHEIRGLAITLLLRQGIDIAAVQRLAAHTDAATTSAYTANQSPDYVNMGGMVVGVQR